jgi:putative ABC transport system permease protein
MWRDLILALRSLRKTPFITAAVFVSLSLGIGANTAIFSLMDQLLLRSLPVHNPQELVFLDGVHPQLGGFSTDSSEGPSAVFSYPMMRDLMAMQTSLQSLAGFRDFPASIAFQGNVVNGNLQLVTGTYFGTLGVGTGLGWLLTEQDDLERQPVAVLSFRYWQDRLGSDPAIINQKMIVNGVPMTVVGVAPKGFHGTNPSGSPDLWTPISLKPQLTPTWDGTNSRRNGWVYLVGRLKPGLTLEQSAAGLQVLYQSLLAEEASNIADANQKFRDDYAQGTIHLLEGLQGAAETTRSAGMPFW